MKSDGWMDVFEKELLVQRYSYCSIQNYKSAVKGFLQMVVDKYSHPLEVTETDIEDYLCRKIDKYHIGLSSQRLIVASIDKFYISVFHRQLQIKHLYPHTKSKCLPVYLTTGEMSRLMDIVSNLKHKCIIQQLLGHKSVNTTEIYTHITDIAQSKIKSPLDYL